MSLETNSASSTPPLPMPPPLSRDSPGIESDYCSDYGSLSSTTDPMSSDSAVNLAAKPGTLSLGNAKTEEVFLLEQWMTEQSKGVVNMLLLYWYLVIVVIYLVLLLFQLLNLDSSWIRMVKSSIPWARLNSFLEM